MGHFWSFLAWNQQGFTPAVLEVPVFWEGLVHDDSPSTGHRVHDLKSFTRVFEACLRVFFGEFCLLILRPTSLFPDILVGGWTNPIWQFESTWIIRPKLKGVKMLKNIFEASPPSQKHPKRVNFFGVFFCLENNQPQGQGGLPYPDTQGSRCIDLHFPPKLPTQMLIFKYHTLSFGLGFLPGRRRYFHYTLTPEFLGNINEGKAMPLKRRSLKVPYDFHEGQILVVFHTDPYDGFFRSKKSPQVVGRISSPFKNPTNSPPPIFWGKWLNWRWIGGNDSTTTWGVPKIGLSTNNAPTN